MFGDSASYHGRNPSWMVETKQINNATIVNLVSGHGEWEDDTKTRCRILWRKPEQLAADVYAWAEANGYINNVCTVYELHSGKFLSRSPHNHFICIFQTH